MIRQKQDEKAFTLIELLIATTIVGLLMGGALVAFARFRDKRLVLNDAKVVVEELRLAQRKALAGEKPEVCLAGEYALEGYEVRVWSDRLEIQARCQEGTFTAPVKTVNLEGSEISSSLSEVFFPTVGTGTDKGQVDVCGLEASGEFGYRVEVSSGGVIDEPAEIEGGCP